MKRILLTSTALVMVAGMATAQQMQQPVLQGAIMSDTGVPMADGDTQVSDIPTRTLGGTSGVKWAADGEFGYNDDVENGFYFTGGLGVSTSAGMNMGLTAGIALDVDLGFDNNAPDSGNDRGAFDNIVIDGSDFVVFVEGQGAALYIGDTETGAATRWAGTTNMQNDGFIEVDDVDDGAKGTTLSGAPSEDYVDAVLRGDLEYGPVVASLSYLLATDGVTGEGGIEGLSLGAEATFGSFVVGLAYQEEVKRVIVDSGPIDEIIGVYAGTTFAGASVKVAYATNQTKDQDSLGVQVDYPFGPVTATAFYSAESLGDDNYGVGVSYASGPITAAAYYHDGQDQEIGIEGSYAMESGLTVYAGYIDGNDSLDDYEAYIAGEYDLGGGASLIASYGDVGKDYTNANGYDLEEVGNAFEVNSGTTVAISFKF